MEILNKEQAISRKLVADVFVNRPIIWVPTECSVENALKVLKDNRILSVPVIDTRSNLCVGVVDVLDVAAFIIAQFPTINVITNESLQNLVYSGHHIARDRDVVQVINFVRGVFKSNTLVPVDLNTTLLGLIDIFAQGVHRVPVIDQQRKQILNFISQSDLLRYFAENIYLLGSLGPRTIEDLGLVNGGVHFARIDASVVTVLGLMTSKGVSAVPAVDVDGKLRGTFSASDLKGIGPFDFPLLLSPLGEYLISHSPKSLFPITCKPTDTYESVVLKIAATKVHRIWCVDDNGLILGVVSITDVMRTFIQSPMDITPFLSEQPFNKAEGARIPIQ